MLTHSLELFRVWFCIIALIVGYCFIICEFYRVICEITKGDDLEVKERTWKDGKF